MFERKTGINVDVQLFLHNRATERKRKAAKDLGMSGVARRFGGFELALDRWICLTDYAPAVGTPRS